MSTKYEKSKESTGDVLIYTMKEEMELLPFLLDALSYRSRNSVKSIMGRGQVKVDDYIVTQFNYILYPGQTIRILKNRAAIKESMLIGLTIQYEDQDLIIVQKDAGLLSVASDKEKELTAHHQLMMYVRHEHPRNKVYVVHRLDKDTSGVMMFAKNERARNILQNAWKDMVKERTYVALVEGEVQKEKDTITSWLRETRTRVVYSSYTKDDGLYAVTHYKKVQANEEFSLLEVELETGRKNQIRVHMKDIGHPVVGDKKYGSKKNVIRRLGLHAKALAFIHPTTEKLMHFESEVPRSFFSKSN